MKTALVWVGLLLSIDLVHSAPSATIDSGVVVGVATSLPSSSATVHKYLGIPFAAPPKRFAPPVRHKKWSEPFMAQKYGPACIQQFNCTAPLAMPAPLVAFLTDG